MGSIFGKKKVEPILVIQETDRIMPPKTMMLTTQKHVDLLYGVTEVTPLQCFIKEPYLKETKDRKFREYADLLENPRLDIVPKERFIAFWENNLYFVVNHTNFPLKGIVKWKSVFKLVWCVILIRYCKWFMNINYKMNIIYKMRQPF